MLAKSDTDITSIVRRFTEKNIDVALLVPTATGLKKSIIDATAPVRSLLKAAGLHDFESQPKGQGSKKVLSTKLLLPTGVVVLQTSLYRPETKDGDPRIWPQGLKGHARANNLLALFADGGQLGIVNCSDAASLGAMDHPEMPLGKIASQRSRAITAEASELLGLLRSISARGFIESVRVGDTGVGTTLETLLGIQANSRKTPDYKGIEIKAARMPRRRQSRVNLFAQAPNWGLSPIGSGANLLGAIGYWRLGQFRYYNTIKAGVPNSQGLFLEVDDEKDWLRQDRAKAGKTERMTVWEFDVLRSRLREKHAQTFWVKAEARRQAGVELFHYTHVVHTRSPLVQNLEPLLDAGTITVDYTLRRLKSGSAKDKGYFFKIKHHQLGALFPPPLEHALC